jgi:hypothetical protein
MPDECTGICGRSGADTDNVGSHCKIFLERHYQFGYQDGTQKKYGDTSEQLIDIYRDTDISRGSRRHQIDSELSRFLLNYIQEE